MRGADCKGCLAAICWSSVHPHMRGADVAFSHVGYVGHGSSPHAWGRSFILPSEPSRNAVHPHMRGADGPRARARRIWITVHPHMRGADSYIKPSHLCQERFIPTCVGQMMPSLSTHTPAIGSSPHAWGRSPGSHLARPVMTGSSPHAWGRCTPATYTQLTLRFIPTCVGQIPIFGNNIPDNGRFIPTCVGQMKIPQMPSKFYCGSSPHAWGRSLRSSSKTAVQRGSSPHAWGRCIAPTMLIIDESGSSPHAWGRLTRAYGSAYQSYGSSPHAWGRWLIKEKKITQKRFIPTCVGQILQRRTERVDDPRFIPTCVGQMAVDEIAAEHDTRFIPTCVGQIGLDLAITVFILGSSPHAWGR